MSDHREALDQILRICNESRTYTRRTQHIHQVAMKALGMTEGQRQARHIAIFERIGDTPGKVAFLARKEKMAKKIAEYYGDDKP